MQVINIITRTFNRPEFFKVCQESILCQTYKNINHIVGSEVHCDYYKDYIPLQRQIASDIPQLRGNYKAPWNLHLNILAEHVKEGWVMYLDDDDRFATADALKIIENQLHDEDEVLLWQVRINGVSKKVLVPSNELFGKVIAGNISTIGFIFHSKHLPVEWGSWNFGDFRVISKLVEKLKAKWIKLVLTETQGKPNLGQKLEPKSKEL